MRHTNAALPRSVAIQVGRTIRGVMPTGIFFAQLSESPVACISHGGHSNRCWHSRGTQVHAGQSCSGHTHYDGRRQWLCPQAISCSRDHEQLCEGARSRRQQCLGICCYSAQEATTPPPQQVSAPNVAKVLEEISEFFQRYSDGKLANAAAAKGCASTLTQPHCNSSRCAFRTPCLDCVWNECVVLEVVASLH
jgi:hypothetical protein